jgi:hypothetical protein
MRRWFSARFTTPRPGPVCDTRPGIFLPGCLTDTDSYQASMPTDASRPCDAAAARPARSVGCSSDRHSALAPVALMIGVHFARSEAPVRPWPRRQHPAACSPDWTGERDLLRVVTQRLLKAEIEDVGALRNQGQRIAPEFEVPARNVAPAKPEPRVRRPTVRLGRSPAFQDPPRCRAPRQGRRAAATWREFSGDINGLRDRFPAPSCLRR